MERIGKDRSRVPPVLRQPIPQTDSGDHEARHDVWYWLTQIKPKQYLGQFYRCQPTVAEAKKTCPKANGCNSASVGDSEALLLFRSEVALAPVHP